MSHKLRGTVRGSVFAFLCLVSASFFAARAQQLPQQAKSQIRRQMAFGATQPAKVHLKILTQNIVVGTNLQLEISLLNTNNEPVAAPADVACEISVRFASGKSISQTFSIKQGETSAESAFPAKEAGLTSIAIRPSLNDVRSDRVEVIVRRTSKTKKKHVAPGTSPALNFDGDLGFAQALRNRSHSLLKQASLATVSEELAPPFLQPQPATSPTAVLHISLNDPSGNYRANGKDAAVIEAVFESPDLSPAPTDIHIWFHWTNGLLSPTQPLVIRKGAFSAEAQLTSLWPGDVHFTFVSSTPPYQPQGDTDTLIHFIPPGAALVGPDRLSLVDNTPIMVVFYDAQQKPIPPGKDWSITLRSSKSRLHFAPQSFQIQAGSPVGSSSLFPVSWGTDTVEAVVADYTVQPLTIIITGWLVVGLCLGGGIAGGLAAYNKFKGSWVWRIFIGILGGAVFCWLYVYLALPNVNANIAHNTFSVVFVALIGGYLGTTALDLAAKQFGWISR